jgi:threonine dehydratase
VTGSFKPRGALNKILSLEKWEQEAGLVAASAGNHGQGVALSANLIGASVTVFASDHAPQVKLDAIRKAGAMIIEFSGDYISMESAAIAYASQKNMTWVSPYNDPQVIAGQGTLGLEISKQVELKKEMTLLVPVGGGGLISGIGAAFNDIENRPRIVGVQSEASAFMHGLYKHGSQENIQDLPSIADGLSGGLEEGSTTIALTKNFADDMILVSEEEIGRAIAFAWFNYQQKIEGSAAVTLAAVLSGKIKTPAICLISGGNIQPARHAELCERYKGQI